MSAYNKTGLCECGHGSHVHYREPLFSETLTPCWHRTDRLGTLCVCMAYVKVPS